jgi:hypothetical protein
LNNNRLRRIIYKWVWIIITTCILILMQIVLKQYEGDAITRNDVYGAEKQKDDLEIDGAVINANEKINMETEMIETEFEDENNLEIESAEIEDEQEEATIENQPTIIPDLIGMDETGAVNKCAEEGYSYTIAYYLGGNNTVIAQETIPDGNNEKQTIRMSVGLSESEFSAHLLEIINSKRNAQGLENLRFSEELNYACNILAEENVNSVSNIRPNGEHWSSVIFENGIGLMDGTFTTRSNISSLEEAGKRLKYQPNSYGDGNLLTPEYNLIGMAYSSDKTLVIIVGN